MVLAAPDWPTPHNTRKGIRYREVAFFYREKKGSVRGMPRVMEKIPDFWSFFFLFVAKFRIDLIGRD